MIETQPCAGNRVVALVGSQIWHRNTCATLIQAGVNLVGICRVRQKSFGLPISYLRWAVRKQGLFRVIDQIAGRIAYLALNKKKDQVILNRLFDGEKIDSVLNAWNGPLHVTSDYSAPETVEWLRALQPDILVVHTSAWVGKRVRAIPAKGIVIGGHPGITPYYRGAHSAFWAIHNNHPDDVGWSVFWLDEGVDTGDLITQERIAIEPGDSYFTLGWKSMICIAEAQARVIREFDSGRPIRRVPHDTIPPDSNFGVPTLREYLRYRRRQKLCR